ncbi:hypothetical protein [Seinonella peptonophila]|nr:hypothetical protein [Seinonella peptonophila]
MAHIVLGGIRHIVRSVPDYLLDLSTYQHCNIIQAAPRRKYEVTK